MLSTRRRILSKTIGSASDQEFTEDLNIVTRGLPGKGEALGRLISRAGVTQQVLADRLQCDRSAVSHWLRETRWPSGKKLIEVLIALNLDMKAVNKATAVMFGGQLTEEVLNACGN